MVKLIYLFKRSDNEDINMSQQTYLVNNTRRLIDLNGKSTNFTLTFTCTSKNNLPFEILVVDQKTLDKNPNIPYKEATNGIISGNIVADKNVYQNYFLVIKAKKQCQVVVKTVKKEIQPTENYRAQVRAPSKLPPVSRVTAQPKWKTIALVIVIMGGGALLYYLYKKGKTVPPSVNTVTVPSLEVHVPPTASPRPSSDLLGRLKNLPI
jgi:hypothetical protein